ncbi:MAG: hypothetical protein WBB28_10715 [Crinalium sp.]
MPHYTLTGDTIQPPTHQAFQAHPPAQNQTVCPGCGVLNPQKNIVVMPPNSKHFAAVRCADCDRFLGWQSKPENVAKWELRSRLIASWLGNPRLSINDWERTFLSGIATAQNISPKQQGIFDKIQSRLGGAV